MAQVLYRKYRPQSFSEVKGQENIIPLLRQSVLTDNLSHAYLFSGPRGCGKTTVARIMAKAVNCEHFKEKGDVCNECVSCKSINDGSCVDVIEMDAASNRGVEEIRSLKDKVNFLPSFLKYKVYIIDEAHMLTKEAFNALLKTLEEPPEHVIFILATTESNKLPVTILSRVTRFDFQFGTENEVVEKLQKIAVEEEIEVEDKALEIVFKYSGGSFRDAESLLGKIILSSNNDKKITLKMVSETLGIVSDENINLILQLLRKGDIREVREFITKIFSVESDQVLLIDQLLSGIKEEIYRKISEAKEISKLSIIANGLIKLKTELRDFTDKKTLIEIGFIEICDQINKWGNGKESEMGSKPNNSNSNGGRTSGNSGSATNDSKESNLGSDLKTEAGQGSKISELKQLPVISTGGSLSFQEYLIEKSKQTIPRLVPIIKSSQIEVKDSEIMIKNRHSFNLSYLQKVEVKGHIKNIALEFFKKDFSITFQVLNPVTQVNSDEDKSDSDLATLANQKKVVDSIIREEELNKAKEIKIIDNTDLVESILLG